MSRLIVITTPDLEPGYKLAGADTILAASQQEAVAELLELVDGQGERGVIALHEPYHSELDRETRRRFEETYEPLVVALPSGEVGAEDGGRRERFLKMLWQAVGYEITFDAEGGE